MERPMKFIDFLQWIVMGPENFSLRRVGNALFSY